ncbi:hypothetical protein DUI87_07167 [Hirundo rustica rustica]|uniref:Uncharacterized protein n=1 Tax=Hirundo rustica rustica TaxID=333673 RepID=A0A3M0KP02_HIRRU|nr:hypothetical protein DUI87_07167 [Hirundo rustica rustica]
MVSSGLEGTSIIQSNRPPSTATVIPKTLNPDYPVPDLDPLIEPSAVVLSPLIESFQVSLLILPLLKQSNTPSQLTIIWEFTESAPSPHIQIVNKDVKLAPKLALGNTSSDLPPVGCGSSNHSSLGLASQPVFYPSKSTPIQKRSRELF